MSSSRDLFNQLVVAVGLNAVTSTGGSAVTSFDRNNGGNPVHDLVAAVSVGTITTGPTTVTMVESDTTDVPSAMTAVDDSEVQGSNPLALTTANDDQVHNLGYLGNKRYVGFTISVTGTAGALSITHIAGNPRSAIVSA